VSLNVKVNLFTAEIDCYTQVASLGDLSTYSEPMNQSAPTTPYTLIVILFTFFPSE